jgi:hypothetical protein
MVSITSCWAPSSFLGLFSNEASLMGQSFHVVKSILLQADPLHFSRSTAKTRDPYMHLTVVMRNRL